MEKNSKYLNKRGIRVQMAMGIALALKMGMKMRMIAKFGLTFISGVRMDGGALKTV